MAEADLIVIDVAAPLALLLLDVLRDWQALDHLPSEAGGRGVFHPSNLAMALLDLISRPDIASRNMMKGGDHALDACLQHVIHRRQILRPKPAPCLSHPRLPDARAQFLVVVMSLEVNI